MEAERSIEPNAAATAALSTAYTSYRTRLIRHLYRLTSEWATAEDLCQETFLRAWCHWWQHGPPDVPQAWLYTVATHLAYDELRRQRRRPQSSCDTQPGHEPATAGFEETVEQRDMLSRLLQTLSAQDAALLVAQAMEQTTIRELAARLGWPEGTVKSRGSRIRAALRKRGAELLEFEYGGVNVEVKLSNQQGASS